MKNRAVFQNRVRCVSACISSNIYFPFLLDIPQKGCHYYSFDFLSLDNVDFENYFANKLINMGRYIFKHLKHLYSRALSDIKCSVCSSHSISDKALLRSSSILAASCSMFANGLV